MKIFSARGAWLVVGCSALLAGCSTSPAPTVDQANVASTPPAPEASTPPAPKAVDPSVVATIFNPGFEQEWEAWDELPDGGDLTAISDDSNSGEHSAKITENEGRFEQTVAVQPNTNYEVLAYIQGGGEIGIELPGETLTADPDGLGEAWLPLRVAFNTGNATEIVVFGAYKNSEVRLDDFSIAPIGE